MYNNQQNSDFLGGQGLFQSIGNFLSDPVKRKKRLEKKDAKNKLKDSEANLNNALAAQAYSQSQNKGVSTGAIIGISLGAVALLGLVAVVILREK
jgi:hypothetical protein